MGIAFSDPIGLIMLIAAACMLYGFNGFLLTAFALVLLYLITRRAFQVRILGPAGLLKNPSIGQITLLTAFGIIIFFYSCTLFADNPLEAYSLVYFNNEMIQRFWKSVKANENEIFEQDFIVTYHFFRLPAVVVEIVSLVFSVIIVSGIFFLLIGKILMASSLVSMFTNISDIVWGDKPVIFPLGRNTTLCDVKIVGNEKEEE